MVDHICIHEREIVLALDHIKDIGADTKKNNDALVGNGKPGLLTRTALTEQAIKNLIKFQWFNTAAILSAAIKIMFFGGS